LRPSAAFQRMGVPDPGKSSQLTQEHVKPPEPDVPGHTWSDMPNPRYKPTLFVALLALGKLRLASPAR
jgi:hypothetical protein